MLSFMYTLASRGCAGVNLETGVNQLGFISSYSPLGDDERGHYAATPEFYGMLAFAHWGVGRLVAANLESGGRNLEAYATQSSNDRILLTLINKESTTDANFRLEVPAGFQKGSLLRLAAPSLHSKTGVLFGGAAVGASGKWSPSEAEEVRASGGKLSVLVPAASAAVVTLQT